MREVAGYQIVRRLGEGGMGSVYLAEAPDGRQVAIKVIRGELLESEEFRARFRSEVSRAQAVPPFCTAEVIAADPDHDPPYLVIEYVDGPDLAHVVRESGPMGGAALHSLAVGVATALAAIHGAGVVHRDLKPGNVLLSRGSVKVIDFGIARELDTSTVLTGANQVMGTVPYISPERLGGVGTLTPAADIFAWGAVITFAATGRTPFGGDTPATTAIRIMTEPPNLEGLTGPLRDIVERTLAKDPVDRPTARELLDHLLTGSAAPRTASVPKGPDRVRAAAEPTTADLGSTMDVAPPVPPRPGRRIALAVAALVLVAGIAAAVAVAGGALRSHDANADAPPNGSPSPSGSSSPAPPVEQPLTEGMRLIFKESLTTPGYWTDKLDRANKATCQVGAGGLTVTVSGTTYRCPGPLDNLGDVAVFVDIKITSGTCGTVWWRFRTKTGGYALLLCEKAAYFVRHVHDVTTRRTYLFDKPTVPGEAVRLGIVHRGSEVRFFVGGRELPSWTDDFYADGRVVLGILQRDSDSVGGNGQAHQAVFANLEVWGNPTTASAGATTPPGVTASASP